MGTNIPAPGIYTLRGATSPGINWDGLYRHAVASGRDYVVPADEEGTASPDELIGDTIRALVVLGELAALARFARLVEDQRAPLRDLSAGCIRALDRALAVHARDNDYQSEEWIGRAVIGAAASVSDIEEEDRDIFPLPLAIRRAGSQVAEVVVALHRDRTQVPSLLMGAAGELLLVYAAAMNP